MIGLKGSCGEFHYIGQTNITVVKPNSDDSQNQGREFVPAAPSAKSETLQTYRQHGSNASGLIERMLWLLKMSRIAFPNVHLEHRRQSRQEHLTQAPLTD